MEACNLVLLVFQSFIVGISASVPTKPSISLFEAAHLVALIGLTMISPREHYRSVSPSYLVTFYLSIRTFVNVSTLLLLCDRGFVLVQVLRTILEAVNLTIESQSKIHFLLDTFRDYAPEETAGLWSKATFAWVNPILFAGKDLVFSLGSLPQNPRQFEPSKFRQRILMAWDRRCKSFDCVRFIRLDKGSQQD